MEDYQAIDQVATEAGGAVVADKSDVEYSKIDFSQIKRKTPTEAGTAQGTTETEYAEIKNKEMERQDNGGEGGEMLEGNEEEVMIGEDKETQECMSADKQGGGDVMVYSNVKEIMGED